MNRLRRDSNPHLTLGVCCHTISECSVFCLLELHNLRRTSILGHSSASLTPIAITQARRLCADFYRLPAREYSTSILQVTRIDLRVFSPGVLTAELAISPMDMTEHRITISVVGARFPLLGQSSALDLVALGVTHGFLCAGTTPSPPPACRGM